MNKLTVTDGTEIYFKDLGKDSLFFFHHGWPLSSDDRDAQMMFINGSDCKTIKSEGEIWIVLIIYQIFSLLREKM